MGISEVSKSLQDCAYSAFYGNITTKEAAEKFRKEANEILERNNLIEYKNIGNIYIELMVYDLFHDYQLLFEYCEL